MEWNIRRTLATISIAVLVVTTGCTTGINSSASDQNQTEPTGSLGTVGLAEANSGPACLNQTRSKHSGWVHVAGNDGQFRVTFDAVVRHRAGESVKTSLSSPNDGVYILRINRSTRDEMTEQSPPRSEEGCQLATRTRGGGLIGADFERLEVRIDGDRSQMIKRQGTIAVLRELPNPINLSDQ